MVGGRSCWKTGDQIRLPSKTAEAGAFQRQTIDVVHSTTSGTVNSLMTSTTGPLPDSSRAIARIRRRVGWAGSDLISICTEAGPPPGHSTAEIYHFSPG
jgi:hypothetical protein